jgi:Golgi nucleoside diphosphatase
MPVTWALTVLSTALLFQAIDQSDAAICSRTAKPSGIEKYAVLCDAGSSGTRVKVYKYFVGLHDPIDVTDIKELKVPKPYKVKPGLSEFGDSTDDIDDYLDDLIDSAKQVVPADQQASTPIYVFATAGMRLLDEDKVTHLTSNHSCINE